MTHPDDIPREAANDVVEAKLADLTGTLLAERALLGTSPVTCGERIGAGAYACNRPRDHYGRTHAEIMAPGLGRPVIILGLWLGAGR